MEELVNTLFLTRKKHYMMLLLYRVEWTAANTAKFISNGCDNHAASKMKHHAVGWE
jgi:hypothetical protein